MYYALLAFVFPVMWAMQPGPLAIMKTSDNLQNTSSFVETLSTYDALNSIQFLCKYKQHTTLDIDELDDDELIYYCEELIQRDDKHVPFKYIIDTKIKEIRSSLIKLLNLENKAIVCRGMRYLLPIIMYSIFINKPVNRSLGNGSSGTEIFEFDELLKKKSDFSNNKNQSFEKKLQQIKASRTKNVTRTNENLGAERSEQGKGGLRVTTSSGVVDKIKTTVQLILPFTARLDCFQNLNKIYEAMTTPCNKSDIDLLLLLVLDEIKTLYRTECRPDVDVAALVHNGETGGKFEHNFDSISLLVGEIDRLSFAIREDLVALHPKFSLGNDSKRHLEEFTSVSIVLHHTFNKSRDPEVWRLIGDETVVDSVSDDIAKPVARSMDDVVRDVAKNIDRTMSGLTTLFENSVRCRCYAYLYLIMKLYCCTVRALAANLREVRRAVRGMEAEDLHRIAPDKVNRLNALHDQIMELGTAECLIGDDDVAAIHKLLDQDTGDKYFLGVYAVYWNRNARSVGVAVETIMYRMPDLGLVVEFTPLLRNIRELRNSEMKDSVEGLVKWYKWVERTYNDHCFPGDSLSKFSVNMKQVMSAGLSMPDSNKKPTTILTLEWMMEMIDTFNIDLKIDTTQI